jgi:cell division protein FtsL
MSPQFLVYLLLVVVALAVILWIVLSAKGRALQDAARADVDELHTKVDSIHARITNLISEVRGSKVAVLPARPPASGGDTGSASQT